KVKDALTDKQYRQEDIQKLISELLEDVRNIEEELSEYINFPSWNRPLLFDYDDDDYTILTPVLPIGEPDNSLSMGDEHLDTIPETESNEIIKSSVENLVPIPSEFKGISDDTCDVPVCEDPSTFDALKDHSRILSDSNNDGTLSDDDDFEDIDYVNLEEVNDVDQEKEEFDLENIFQIQDVILREKLLNINCIIANIESLNNNSTLNCVLKSPSLFPISIIDSDSFSDHTEETRSGSTTTHANYSLPEYDSFLFEIKPDQGGFTSIAMNNNSTNDPLLEAANSNDSLPEFESSHFDLYDDPSFPRPPPEPPDVEISLIIEPDTPVINNFDELNEDECFNLGGGRIDVSQNAEDDDSFAFVIRTFLPFLTYHVDSHLLLSTESEDTIFDPGIST
ncbi:hypothetical protein Tco_1035600, partial [Tanacetum coccineum]